MKKQSGKIGVIYVLHGGMDRLSPRFMWDASIQMFSYDPNHPVYSMVIWNSANWSMVMQTEFAVKFIRKYEFEYACIGGTDPFHTLSDMQLADMKACLDQNTFGLTFEVDYACWMAADRIEHYPYPRFIYTGPEEAQNKCTYCGEDEPGGPWPGCSPERYNVDGPAERLLKKGVERIIMIDLTVGGPRFFKTYDVVQMTRRVLDAWNREHKIEIPLVWVNDYSRFMERAYPTAPDGWTPFLGKPEAWQQIPLSGSPNPVAADPELALLNVEGIEAGMSPHTGDAATGILLFNHGLFSPERKYFDPKIDDTTLLNRNIKSALLARHPDMNPDNIIGAYGGTQELNPENGLIERTRRMRGEDIAYSNLYGSDLDMPGQEWGFRYWDGLEYLKNRGVKHIVIGFPQVATDAVLNLVELCNQIGKEIGIKTWLRYKQGDYVRYPVAGHPFTDYWGNWVDTACSRTGGTCCFTMGGCKDGGVYPPPRQTPPDEKREDMDPSLAFDLSDYGHLGYDPALGAPDPEKPVQQQYTGTWDFYTPPNSDRRVGRLLARHVLSAAVQPMVHITTRQSVQSIRIGESVSWDAHCSGGVLPYTHAWSVKKDGEAKWKQVAVNTASWTWTPTKDEQGTYSIRCLLTDSRGLTGEVVWENFVVEGP